jgi:hypothetical protein
MHAQCMIEETVAKPKSESFPRRSKNEGFCGSHSLAARAIRVLWIDVFTNLEDHFSLGT